MIKQYNYLYIHYRLFFQLRFPETDLFLRGKIIIGIGLQRFKRHFEPLVYRVKYQSINEGERIDS